MSDLFAIAFWFLVHVIGGIAEALAAMIILCGLLNIAAMLGGFCAIVGSAIASVIVELFRGGDAEEGRQ